MWWESRSGRRCQRGLPGGTPGQESRASVTEVPVQPKHPPPRTSDTGDYPSCPGGFTLSWFRVACLSDPLPEIRLQERLDICNQEGQRRTRRPHISRQQKETHRLCPPSLSAGSTVRSKTSQKSTMWALNIWILCFPLAITIATPHTALVPNWGLEVT